MAPFAHVTGVGDGFLPGCSSLTSLDLTPFARRTVHGGSFHGCCGLTVLDLTPLAHVTGVGSLFLFGCSSGLTAAFDRNS